MSLISNMQLTDFSQGSSKIPRLIFHLAWCNENKFLDKADVVYTFRTLDHANFQNIKL